jgi:hypothetical protein
MKCLREFFEYIFGFLRIRWFQHKHGMDRDTYIHRVRGMVRDNP